MSPGNIQSLKTSTHAATAPERAGGGEGEMFIHKATSQDSLTLAKQISSFVVDSSPTLSKLKPYFLHKKGLWPPNPRQATHTSATDLLQDVAASGRMELSSTTFR